ncbi:MAG: tRNA (5-methylaminomethyl-2-thiouridine)(34)-methyltransferase MnmD [Cytophagaceae bacterium]|nr:tRNA (5-methylaminomethyl-2-thiouridine)(34)-methyltransferase MnmD [Cytophagaceae bacterium]
MERLLTTTDGSHTLFSERFGQAYHSAHGALTESRRVYLELGFEYVAGQNPPVRVLEMGFGTGLNALLTWMEAEKRGLPVQYTALEAYPIGLEDVAVLNYDQVLKSNRLRALHEAAWGEDVSLSEWFTLRKMATTLEEFCADGERGSPVEEVDVIYFDAFGPRTQPELWTAEIFTALAKRLRSGGVLTTYSSKGSVRRALKQAGFTVEKHRGPPGKLEVVRAIKR